jgi:hypothetical protein
MIVADVSEKSPIQIGPRINLSWHADLFQIEMLIAEVTQIQRSMFMFSDA